MLSRKYKAVLLSLVFLIVAAFTLLSLDGFNLFSGNTTTYVACLSFFGTIIGLVLHLPITASAYPITREIVATSSQDTADIFFYNPGSLSAEFKIDRVHDMSGSALPFFHSWTTLLPSTALRVNIPLPRIPASSSVTLFYRVVHNGKESPSRSHGVPIRRTPSL